MDKVSVIIPAHNEGDNLVDTVYCIIENTSYPDFEVVVVDDGSTDGSGDNIAGLCGNGNQVSMFRVQDMGVAGARNFGATRASGTFLIFLDGHCYTPPGWMEKLIRPLADKSVGVAGPAIASILHDDDVRGFGLTWRDASLELEWLGQQDIKPYAVPMVTGACQVVRKEDFEKLGQYDSGMTRWGSEDEELCLRYWLMGYEVVVQPETVVYHLFRKSHPYEVDCLRIIYNQLRMAMLHLSEERINRVLDYYQNIAGFDRIMSWLGESDAADRREQLFQSRCRSDDWFCETFGCQI